MHINTSNFEFRLFSNVHILSGISRRFLYLIWDSNSEKTPFKRGTVTNYVNGAIVDTCGIWTPLRLCKSHVLAITLHDPSCLYLLFQRILKSGEVRFRTLIYGGVDGVWFHNLLLAGQVLYPFELRPRVCLFNDSTSIIVADSYCIGKYYFLLYKSFGTGGIYYCK